MGRLVCSCLALVLAAGCDAGVSLIVVSRTDMTPGVEFAAVRVEVFQGSTHGEPEAVVTAPAVGDFLVGVQVAELHGLSPGPRRIRVSLINADGEVILDGTRLVEVRTATIATILLTRDCRGLSCPDPGGNPSHTACLGGRCGDEACIEEMPELCGEPECISDADCPTPAPCASAECDASGTCLTTMLGGSCPMGEVCDVVLGCGPECGRVTPELAVRSTGHSGTMTNVVQLSIAQGGRLASRHRSLLGPGGEISIDAPSVIPGTYTLRLFIDLDDDGYCDPAVDTALELEGYVHPGAAASFDPSGPTLPAVCDAFPLLADVNFDDCVDTNDQDLVNDHFVDCIAIGLGGDVSTDGRVDGVDLGIILEAMSNDGIGCGGRCVGDVDGNRVVSPGDVSLANDNAGCTVGAGAAVCDASDIDGDGMVTAEDSRLVMDRLGACCVGDVTNDRSVDGDDEMQVTRMLGCAVGAGDAACNAADVDGSGAVDGGDLTFVQLRARRCAPSARTP